MRRRGIIGMLAFGGVPLVCRAQPIAISSGLVRRIGLLSVSGRGRLDNLELAVFRRQLQALGWRESQNIQYELHYAEGDPSRLPSMAADLVKVAPDAILAAQSASVSALRKLTQSIPIVFTNVPDPVSQGFVFSLARPGGNITGFTNFDYLMGTKWLQFLKEIAPRVTRVVVAFTPLLQNFHRFFNLLEEGGKAAGVEIIRSPLLTMSDLQRLDTLARKPGTGLIALPNFFVTTHRDEIIKVAARDRLPAIYPFPGFTEAGGLLSYGPDLIEMYRNAASYVDRILRGAKPADLPVQNPIKYTLSINLRTAKTLGLTVSQSLLTQADGVIK